MNERLFSYFLISAGSFPRPLGRRLAFSQRVEQYRRWLRRGALFISATYSWYTRLSVWTASTKASAFSGGVNCEIPWPKLNTWPDPFP